MRKLACLAALVLFGTGPPVLADMMAGTGTAGGFSYSATKVNYGDQLTLGLLVNGTQPITNVAFQVIDLGSKNFLAQVTLTGTMSGIPANSLHFEGVDPPFSFDGGVSNGKLLAIGLFLVDNAGVWDAPVVTSVFSPSGGIGQLGRTEERFVWQVSLPGHFVGSAVPSPTAAILGLLGIAVLFAYRIV